MSVIGIDLDDVLADFMGQFVIMANRKYGFPEVGALPVDWEWSNLGMSREQQDALWEDVKATWSFWTTLDVEPGVDFPLLQQLENKHSVFYPTARIEVAGKTVAQQSAWWLNNRLGVRFPTVIASYEKGPLAAALKYDFFLDDRPKNCLDIQKACPNCRVFLKDSSHNQTFNEKEHGFTRVKDFNEFAKIILEGK